jgi:hypothetical protein
MEWLGSGCYEDEYIKGHEVWQFASRRLIEIGDGPRLRRFVVS